MITVEHPTDRTNFTIVWSDDAVSVAFSYSTPVAFRNAGRWVVRVNDWGPTTGKHLNYLDSGDKSSRLSADVWESAYHDANGV